MQVTDDAQAHKKGHSVGQLLQPFDVRMRHLAAWCDAQTRDDVQAFWARYGPLDDVAALREDETLRGHPYRHRYEFRELRDAFGDTITDTTYTAIVCSVETLRGCQVINERRVAAGMAPLHVYVAPLMTDGAGEKYSSTAIRAAQPLAPPDAAAAAAVTATSQRSSEARA